MAILDKTKIFLWAKFGKHCAFCKTELVASGELNIGKELRLDPKSTLL